MKHSFKLGFVSITPAAALALAENGLKPEDVLKRHAQADWGDVSETFKKKNDLLLLMGLGVRSIYILPKSTHQFIPVVGVWVITDIAVHSINGEHRRTTTVLMADDYLEYKPPFI